MEPEVPSRVQGLLERARAGDRRAFEELLQAHRSRLEAHLHQRLGPALRARVEVSDLLQETFLRALRDLGKFEWKGETSFLRWLEGIASHAILEVAGDIHRHPVKELQVEPPARRTSASQMFRRNERFDRLRDALGSLSDEHREVLILARLQKLPLQEVARRMNRTPAAVSQLLVRALQKLKGSFGDTESISLPPRNLEKELGGDRPR